MNSISKGIIAFISTAVGGVALFYGGAFIIFLIVCTGGAGLIPILIIGAGLIVLFTIIIKILQATFRSPKSKKESPILTTSQKKLIVYINACENSKIIKENIVKKLVEEGGWKQEVVEEAYTIRDKFKYFDNRYII